MSNKPRHTPKNYETDIHHPLCKSRGGKNVPENREEVRIITHRSIHHLFENDTPIEGAIRWFTAYNNKIVKEEAKQDIYDYLMGKEVKDIYENGILRNGIIRPKK